MHRTWISILRVSRYGLKNFARNAWLSVAATAVMVLTLSVLLVTFSARMVFNDTIAKIQQKIDVSLYLKDGVTEDQKQQLTEALKKLPVVSTIDYISKDQARDAFIQQNKAYPEQIQALSELGDANPFPASLRVHTASINGIDTINELAGQAPYKDWQTEAAQVSNERREAINTIEKTAAFSEMVGLVASVIFVTLSIMIIFNTIRMAIFNRRDEIEIMKLIGASKGFIRGPFIIEASLYGVIASIISSALVYTLLIAVKPGLANYDVAITPTINFFMGWFIVIFAAVLLVGVLIGIISSLLAMRRHLRLN